MSRRTTHIRDALLKFVDREVVIPPRQTEIARVDSINLDDEDDEGYFTAKVTLFDDPEEPTSYDKVPIDYIFIPRPRQRVQLTRRDDGGGTPWAITGIIYDDAVVAPPKIVDFTSESLKFDEGDVFLHTDTGLILLKVDGTIHLITGKAQVTMQPDGQIELLNEKGFIDLEAGGKVNINGNHTVDP